MKNGILPILVASLMILTVVGASCTAGAAINAARSQKIVPMQVLGTGYIAGIITNASGSPVENAHVTAFVLGLFGTPAIAVASTATNGHYELTVPAGRYNVIAFKIGEGGAIATPVIVESGQTTDLDLSLSGGIIPGAMPSARVQSFGVISEPLLPAQTVVMDPVTAPVAMPEDPIESTAEIAGTGTIEGEITNQNGNPVAFVRVVAVGNPNDPDTQLGFTITHLFLGGGKGHYSMSVPSGQYLFVRAGKLPFYIGAWAGPVVVNDGETITLDLSLTYIGPDSVEISEPVSSQQSTVSENTCSAVVKTVSVNTNQL